MITLRAWLIATVSLPAGLGLSIFFLATTLQGADARGLFRIGTLLLIVAVVAGSLTWIKVAWNHTQLENEVKNLRRTMRSLHPDELRHGDD